MSMDLFFVSGSPSENKFGQTAGEVLQEFFNKSDEPLAQAARKRGMITQVKDPKATKLRDALARQVFKWFHPGAVLWIYTRECLPMPVGSFMKGRLSRISRSEFIFEQGMPERPKAPQPRNEMVYQGLRLNVHRDARGNLYPTLGKPALTADFTYENFCEEAAEELLRVKDLEKRLEYNNLKAE